MKKIRKTNKNYGKYLVMDFGGAWLRSGFGDTVAEALKNAEVRDKDQYTHIYKTVGGKIYRCNLRGTALKK